MRFINVLLTYLLTDGAQARGSNHGRRYLGGLKLFNEKLFVLKIILIFSTMDVYRQERRYIGVPDTGSIVF